MMARWTRLLMTVTATASRQARQARQAFKQLQAMQASRLGSSDLILPRDTHATRTCREFAGISSSGNLICL
jgi:hypothetical protein